MERFKLEILSAEKVIYSGNPQVCTVVTPAGSIGLEAKHESFLAPLASDSKITIIEGSGQKKEIGIRHGVLAFLDNKCTITVGVKED